jgi:tRNA 2-selenouridine synthase
MTYKSYTTYKNLFLNSQPLLDVRSESEFAQGSFPNTTNIPLLNDAERHEVGLCYAKEGHAAAVVLGKNLVSGERKKQLMADWLQWARANPSGLLFCWRGGERSRIAQTWLKDCGVNIPRIEGGFKALRHFLLEEMDRIIAQTNFLVIAGQTGSGKTELIQDIPNAIDLEAIANHRGSAFGGMTTPQPTQINFDHTLAIQFLKLNASGVRTIVVEDESHMIGKSALPRSLYEKILNSPLLVLEESEEDRVTRIVENYVGSQTDQLLNNLDKIAKRLGGLAHKDIRHDLEEAITLQKLRHSNSLHRKWIKKILKSYYDPMYYHLIDRRKTQILVQDSCHNLKKYLSRTPAF